MGEEMPARDRRGQARPVLSYFTHWIVICTFLIQLALGAIAYGRLDGRVEAIEKDLGRLMDKAISER
jgi:hypothetical protein